MDPGINATDVQDLSGETDGGETRRKSDPTSAVQMQRSLDEQTTFPEYRRALSSRDSILSNSSCVSKDSNEVDGPSSRKPSTTSRFLPGSTGGSSGGSSLRPSVVGAFLLTTLRIDVESDGPSALKDVVPPTAAKDSYELWGDILASWEDSAKRRKKTIRELVYDGVPDKVRCLAWMKLAKGTDQEQEQLRRAYTDLMERDSPFIKIIRRDLARTFPDQEMFKEADGHGQVALLNMMKAYSIYDREVGYCQGSPFIAGLLLMQMPEEDAFYIFVRIMHHYGMRDLFKPSMTALDVCLHLLDKLAQEHCSDLHAHIQDKGMVATMFASSWFLTIFASTLNVDAAFRIMDLFLCDGMDAVFRVALAILLDKREQLLKLDMPGMMNVLQTELRTSYSSMASIDALIKKAYSLKMSHKKLVKLGKDYQHQREKDTEEGIENRAIRAENLKLSKRIEDVEAEVHRITNDLVACQMGHAELVADGARLRKDLALGRRRIKEEEERRKAERQDINRPLASDQPTVDSANFVNYRRRQMAESAQQKEVIEQRLREAELTHVSLKIRHAELEDDLAEVNHLKSQNESSAQIVVELRQTVAELRNQVQEAENKLQARRQQQASEQRVNGSEDKQAKPVTTTAAGAEVRKSPKLKERKPVLVLPPSLDMDC
eukprot:scpid48288/ scgid32245/ TBC1 domain family member CG11727